MVMNWEDFRKPIQELEARKDSFALQKSRHSGSTAL
jgi:hypothetical protein